MNRIVAVQMSDSTMFKWINIAGITKIFPDYLTRNLQCGFAEVFSFISSVFIFNRLNNKQICLLRTQS